jgi:energy-coupling factor transporter ATP-binding protein EcfA2
MDASIAGAGRFGDGAVIEARGIRKPFGATQALAGVDLTAHAGRVLALLGPNGAGKTTFVRILTTLLRGDQGWARVKGFVVQRDAAALRSPLVSGSTGSCACSKISSGSAEPRNCSRWWSSSSPAPGRSRLSSKRAGTRIEAEGSAGDQGCGTVLCAIHLYRSFANAFGSRVRT